MTLFWIVLVLALVLVLGQALVLLRTAKPPKLPEGFESKPHRQDEDE